MTALSPTTRLKPVGSFFTAAIVWALLAAIVFGFVAGLVAATEGADGAREYSWGWALGGFALSGLLFMPIVMGFEALRRVGFNQRILGAKLDAIHDHRDA